MFGRFVRHCATLNRYQSAARYPPMGPYEFDRHAATEAVNLAQELLDFVRTKIGRRKEMGLL